MILDDKISNSIRSFGEDILKEWQQDDVLDIIDLSKSNINYTKLHSKYLKYLYIAKNKYNTLLPIKDYIYLKLRNKYQTGDSISREDWENNTVDESKLINRVSIKELEYYISADKEMLEITRNIADIKDVCDILKEIISTINKRSYDIKNIIDDRNFKNGI